MPQGGGTTRWCPTPEQLMMLEEMYRGGLRTPSAAQIQQITAHLACYGRIEGKNVFYWFQNHKARDRQKLRRRLCMTHHLLSCAQYYNQHYLLGHAHAHAHAHAAAAPQYCLDQALVSSPALATAAPYYYPFRAAATSPTSSLFQYQGGGVVPDYSLGKLDNFGVAVDEAATLTASTTDAAAPPGYETDAVQAVSLQPPHEPSPCCRPLRTLELFPTSSASGVKDADDDQLGPTSK